MATDLSGRDKLRVVLATPFGREKIIVAATQAIGILPANRGARFIDRAATRLCVEKLADFFEDVVLLMAKNGAVNRRLCVTPFRLLVRNAKVLCNSKKVAPGYIYSIIAATIGRALRAIEQHPQRTGVLFDLTVSYNAHPEFLGLKEGDKNESAF